MTAENEQNARGLPIVADRSAISTVRGANRDYPYVLPPGRDPEEITCRTTPFTKSIASDEGAKMCLAVPARIVAIDDDQMATVELSGVTRKVALDLVPETKVGDYVIVHVGFAIQRLDEAEAEKTLSLLDELAAATDQPET